jgi:sialate O-acetylesterase
LVRTEWRQRRAKQNLLALPLLLCFFSLAWAAPVLPHLLSDHAVFQQGREIHVWGTADPAEKITVSIAMNTATATADPAGHWTVQLPAMQAGGPFTLKVAGKRTLVVKDVMIGEVWVASGQSNMTFALRGSTGAAEELPKADYPAIRLFTVPKKVAISPQGDTLSAFWQPCTPETAKDFSAVAYYFARDLHRKLNVPIGIMESAWPGTAIEEWIAPEAAQQDPQIKPMLAEWDSHEGKAFAGSRQPFDLEFDDFELLPDPAHPGTSLRFADFDDGSVRNALGGYWSYDGLSAPETVFELVSPGRGGGGYALRVTGGIDASDDSRMSVRFHQDMSSVDMTAYTGIRFWVRGNGVFRFRSLQPTITDWDDYATSSFRASSEWAAVTIWFHDLRQEGWGVSLDFTPQSLTGFVIESMPASGYPPRPAAGLYRGMIAPLLPYPFRGAIWYQGEGNALRAFQYRRLLPDLIKSWRIASHQDQMQFLIVQLPNHGAIPQQPTVSAWAELREAQLLTVKHLPGTGLAVTIDVGDPNDLHPHRKAEVGQRLALWALGTIYHKSNVYAGPLYDSMAVEGKTIRIRFTNIGSGLEAKGGRALRAFAIAGEDRKFHWASALIDGDSIVVSSSEVVAPVAVRYGWADSPECNLFNAEGLPASPFRTDEWRDLPEDTN